MIIEEYHFGKIKINGVIYRNDIRISSMGKILPEWWRGKSHMVEIEDVEDILDDGVEILLLGRGKPGLMSASNDLRAYLEKKKIVLVEKTSSKAVCIANEFFENGKKFAAGFHLTC